LYYLKGAIFKISRCLRIFSNFFNGLGKSIFQVDFLGHINGSEFSCEGMWRKINWFVKLQFNFLGGPKYNLFNTILYVLAMKITKWMGALWTHKLGNPKRLITTQPMNQTLYSMVSRFSFPNISQLMKFIEYFFWLLYWKCRWFILDC
jgi:hypothetical protein